MTHYDFCKHPITAHFAYELAPNGCDFFMIPERAHNICDLNDVFSQNLLQHPGMEVEWKWNGSGMEVEWKWNGTIS